MKQEISVEERLKGTPRPHYLVGNAVYEHLDSQHHLLSKVNFKSEGHPSIQDRAEKYVSSPHVNAGDCCFALWNAAHIMSELAGYKDRIIRKQIIITPKKIIPPDTDLDLEVRIMEEKDVTKNQEIIGIGTIKGIFYHKGTELLNISAGYCAKK